MLTGHSIQLGCTAADPRSRSDLDFLVFLDQSEHWSPPLVGEPKLLLEGRQGLVTTDLVVAASEWEITFKPCKAS